MGARRYGNYLRVVDSIAYFGFLPLLGKLNVTVCKRYRFSVF